MVSSNENVSIRESEYEIRNSVCEKLLRKASWKIYTLARVTTYMNLSKRRIFLNAFFISQFSYCPLVWIRHNRTTYRKISRLHGTYLHIIYIDTQSTFEMLLEKDHSISIHDKIVI